MRSIPTSASITPTRFRQSNIEEAEQAETQQPLSAALFT